MNSIIVEISVEGWRCHMCKGFHDRSNVGVRIGKQGTKLECMICGKKTGPKISLEQVIFFPSVEAV